MPENAVSNPDTPEKKSSENVERRDKLPFYETAKAMLARRDLSCGEKIVYLRLMLYSGGTALAYPSMETLAGAVGGDVQQTRRYIRRLEAKKLIAVERKAKSANRYTLLYRIGIDSILSDTDENNTAKNDSPILSEKIDRKEHRKEKYNNYAHLRNARKSVDLSQSSAPVAESVFPFADFWALYPRKVDKKRAEAIYRKLPEESRALIRERLPRFVQECRSKEFGFIAHPSTWLNGERWLDESATPRTPAQTIEDVMNSIHF